MYYEKYGRHAFACRLYFYEHGHPEEKCQHMLTGARRAASSGEGHSPVTGNGLNSNIPLLDLVTY